MPRRGCALIATLQGRALLDFMEPRPGRRERSDVAKPGSEREQPTLTSQVAQLTSEDYAGQGGSDGVGTDDDQSWRSSP
jgi:hypothetical protein